MKGAGRKREKEGNREKEERGETKRRGREILNISQGNLNLRKSILFQRWSSGCQT